MIRSMLALLASLVSTFVLAQEPPDALVRRVTDEVRAALRADTGSQTGGRAAAWRIAEDKVLAHFNFTRMTRLVVGRSWKDATEPQREALTMEFRVLLVRTYASSISQYREQTIEMRPMTVAPGDQDVVLRTKVIQSDGPSIPIDYRMERTDEGWKVYDMAIDSVSLVTTYRGSFDDQIRESGIDGLVQTLADRNKASEGSTVGVASER